VYLRNPEHRYFLLLEIPPILLIDQYQIQVIPRRELLVHVSEGWSELEATEEQSDGDSLASDWCAIHDLELGDGLGLVVEVGSGTGRFSPDDGEFHVFDFDADEEEVYFADNDVLQVVSGTRAVWSTQSRDVASDEGGQTTSRRIALSARPSSTGSSPLTLLYYTQTRYVDNPLSPPPS